MQSRSIVLTYLPLDEGEDRGQQIQLPGIPKTDCREVVINLLGCDA